MSNYKSYRASSDPLSVQSNVSCALLPRRLPIKVTHYPGRSTFRSCHVQPSRIRTADPGGKSETRLRTPPSCAPFLFFCSDSRFHTITSYSHYCSMIFNRTVRGGNETNFALHILETKEESHYDVNIFRTIIGFKEI